MIWKNLFRRKGRTLLTLFGIAIGVAAIIALGAMAAGMRAGYDAMATGSDADLVLTQESAMDITMGGLEESVGEQLLGWPEVVEVDGALVGNVQAEDSPYFYIYGYDPEGFAIAHFRIVEGQALDEARRVRGKPILLGRSAADSMEKRVGDTLRITGGAFRIVGIYETGYAFEDGGAVMSLDEAQSLLLQPRRVSMYYLRLRSPEEEARLRTRVDRYLDDVTLSTTSEFADRQEMVAYMEGFAWGIAGLAILIGGLVMTNTLFMSVFERTREIGLLAGARLAQGTGAAPHSGRIVGSRPVGWPGRHCPGSRAGQPDQRRGRAWLLEHGRHPLYARPLCPGPDRRGGPGVGGRGLPGLVGQPPAAAGGVEL